MDAQEAKERRESRMIVTRIGAGRYFVGLECEPDAWSVWRGLDGVWRGENVAYPGKMLEASTLPGIKNDMRLGNYVECASAGI